MVRGSERGRSRTLVMQGHTRWVPVVITACMAMSTVTAHAQSQVPAPSPEPSVPASAAPGSSPTAAVAAGDPGDDLWLRDASGLVRVDGTTGRRVGTLDTAVEHCEWVTMVGPADGAIWLTSSGAPGYADPFSQAMGIPVDPDERFCIGRFPLDGSAPMVSFLDLEAHTGLWIGSGTVLDGVLWYAAFVVPEEGGSLGGRNAALYRLDPAVGTPERVTRGVLDVASAGDMLYVVHDAKGTGWPRAGRVDPADGTIQPVDLGLRRYDSVTSVAAGTDLVSFVGSRMDRKAKGSSPWRPQVMSVDPATGAIVQSAQGKVGQGEFTSLAPGLDGIYAVGGGVQGLARIPATDKAKAGRMGPRCRNGRKPGDDSCSVSIVATTPGAVWVQRRATKGETTTSVFERWDRATGQVTVSVPTEELLPPVGVTP